MCVYSAQDDEVKSGQRFTKKNQGMPGVSTMPPEDVLGKNYISK
jgi:hypothetical protein